MKTTKTFSPGLRADLRIFVGALLALAVVVSFVLVLHFN